MITNGCCEWISSTIVDLLFFSLFPLDIDVLSGNHCANCYRVVELLPFAFTRRPCHRSKHREHLGMNVVSTSHDHACTFFELLALVKQAPLPPSQSSAQPCQCQTISPTNKQFICVSISPFTSLFQWHLHLSGFHDCDGSMIMTNPW